MVRRLLAAYAAHGLPQALLKLVHVYFAELGSAQRSITEATRIELGVFGCAALFSTVQTQKFLLMRILHMSFDVCCMESLDAFWTVTAYALVGAHGIVHAICTFEVPNVFSRLW